MTATKDRADVSTDQIYSLLHARYKAPEWAAFGELRNAAGFGASRSCDFFALHTWPSKGFMRVAVEIKVSRGDFFRELNNPKKRAYFQSISHEFYFAAPSGLIKPAEVPEGCGLLEATPKTIRAKVRAKQREPEDLDMDQVTTILRAAADRREQAERKYEAFAEFCGRTISVEDLKSLSEKYWKEIHKWDVVQRAKEEAARNRRSNAKERCVDFEQYESIVKQVIAKARSHFGAGYYDEMPAVKVREWLEQVDATQLRRQAREVRRIANLILGDDSK